VEYARELHAVDDSKLLPPVGRWIDQGYVKNEYDQWVGPGEAVALPVYEGRHVGQFDFAQKEWVSGKGRTAVWRPVPFDLKRITPQFLIGQADYHGYPRSYLHPKLMFMDVASATNARSFFGVAVHR
jgi:hypothetical protein